MKRRRLLILIIGVVGGLILVSEIYAQSGLSISPVTFELTANPGDVFTNKLRVYNPTNSVIAVKMEAEDFTAKGEEGEVRVTPAETETYSLARWIRIEPETFSLEPKGQKFIDFTINVPENAEPGGKYGSVLATIAGIVGGEGITGLSIAQKVGTLVLLTVSGEVKEELRVKEFSAPNFSEQGPVAFLIRFENVGTVHVRPRGFVTINNWRDKKVVDLSFPQKNIIPGAIRKIETTWKEEWLFGKYTATLVGSYGSANIPFDPYVLTFWVLPWKMISGIVLGLALILFFFIKTRRRWGMALRALFRKESKEITS